MTLKNNPTKGNSCHPRKQTTLPCRLAWALLALILSSPLPINAKQVSLRQALNIAKKYITPHSQSAAAPRTRAENPSAAKPFYIFNDAHGKGFVVVSGDDAMGEILAYSENGKLDTLNANPGVKILLQAYRESFEILQQHPEIAKPATRAVPTYKTVKPLLSCKWSQGYPYNKKTGYDYTGCVATAMAQIMYFHKWPAQGKGENTYTVAYDNRQVHADFSQSNYDWTHMKDRYDYYNPYNEVEADAVALLMRDAGFASYMQYTPSSSGAYDNAANKALQNNFDYTTAFVTRADEGTAGFTEIVRQEILNGFPVYLSGFYSLRGSGHAWVTDGQNDQGLFHMNFGWGGQSDGYFSLTAADVAQSGSEFGGKPLSFKFRLTAILAHPNKDNTKPIDPSLLPDSPKLKFSLDGSLRLPEGHAKNFSKTEILPAEMTNFINKGKDFRGDIGVGIFDMEGKLLKICPSEDHATGGFTQRMYGHYDNGTMKLDYLVNTPQKIKVDVSELANGYYQLLPICAPKKEDGTWGEWTRIKLAPRMEIEINDNTVRVAEEGFFEAGFQFAEQPSKINFKPGDEEKIYFAVRNKGGLERTCYAKLQLLDTDNNVKLEIKQEKKTELTGFDVTLLPITVKIPSDFAEGQYKIKLELIYANGEGIDDPAAEHHTIAKLHGKEDIFFQISTQPTGIEENTTADLYLSNDGSTLTLKGNQLQWAKLFDLNGRIIKHITTNTDSQIFLPINNLTPGIYIIKVADNGYIHTRRFIKR